MLILVYWFIRILRVCLWCLKVNRADSRRGKGSVVNQGQRPGSEGNGCASEDVRCSAVRDRDQDGMCVCSHVFERM